MNQNISLQSSQTKAGEWKIISNPNETKTFSADEMIDAYKAGLHDGLSIKRTVKKEIIKNIDLIKSAGEDFFSFLNKSEDNCYSIFLKFNKINSFDLICALRKELYINDDKVKSVYQKSWEVEKELENSEISLNISFIPYSESINSKRLISDGYMFFYGKLQES